MSRTVLAAIDLGPSSARVLYHAAGFARLMSASLKVLHVTGDPGPDDVARVLDFCAQEGPYEIDLMEEDVIVRSGRVSDAIYREAERQKAALVVMGSRGHGGLTRLLLGSSSEAVLQNAASTGSARAPDRHRHRQYCRSRDAIVRPGARGGRPRG
jgi:nucleotide-binding universal stress UspA family protein